MKAFVYLSALLLMLVLLVLLAITIAHLPWWAAVLVVGLAAWMLHAGAPLLFGAAVFAGMSEDMLPLMRHGLLVHGIERCQEVDGPEQAVYWLEVTVTPRQREGKSNEWAPSDLRLIASVQPAPTSPPRWWRLSSACGGEERPDVSVIRVLVHEDGEFVPLAHGLLDGEQRLRVKFRTSAAVRRVALGLDVSWSPALDLPLPEQQEAQS